MDDFWIFSDEATSQVQETLSQLLAGKETLAALTGLRKKLPVDHARSVIDIAELRIRGSEKFSRSSQMFFTRAGLEMASSETISRFKAQRFAGMDSIVDYCCGMGGDLIALRQSNSNCVGIDLDPFSVACANSNLAAYDLPQSASVGNFQVADSQRFAAIHVDPERRTNGRSTYGASFSPPLSEILSLTRHQSVAIKVAPATRLEQENLEQLELTWIGHRRECKQQIIWSGDLVREPGHRAAVSLDADVNNQFSRQGDEADQCVAALAHQVGRYVFEPHNAVLAARLEDSLATELGIKKLAAEIAYFTGDNSIDHGLLSCFEVLQVLPASTKKVYDALGTFNFSDLEIKKRGLTESFAKQFKYKSRKNENGRGTLILTEFRGKRTAIIAKRQPQTA